MQQVQLSPATGAVPLRVLCVGAHSDDIEIGCGATILSLLSATRTVDVTWVVFSGGADRAREARRSARLFLRGAHRTTIALKKFRDGFFPQDFAAIKQEFERLKPVAPDLVFTHYRDDRHQDHRVVSDLTWNTFRDHCVLEYEIPKYDGDLGQPNCFVPVSTGARDLKIKYLLDAFSTQRDKHWFTAETFSGLMRLRGMECRSQTGYAEAFYGRKLTMSVG